MKEGGESTSNERRRKRGISREFPIYFGFFLKKKIFFADLFRPTRKKKKISFLLLLPPPPPLSIEKGRNEREGSSTVKTCAPVPAFLSSSSKPNWRDRGRPSTSPALFPAAPVSPAAATAAAAAAAATHFCPRLRQALAVAEQCNPRRILPNPEAAANPVPQWRDPPQSPCGAVRRHHQAP